MAQISLRHVDKMYGNVVGVKDMTFECRDREFLAILGPSGCGKSTTMRSIAGLERVTTGDILFDGVRVNDDPPAKRNIAMAFENFGLYPHMTVQENIAYPLKLRGMPMDQIAIEVLRVAGVLKITGNLLAYPADLSGGVRQRVSLARAMIRKPAVFLLDEPISHLDAGLRAEMRLELRRLHEESGSTMIYVTHDQREALTMADRVAVMANGRLQQLDTPARIYERPANRFVASFVGDPSMNFLAAAIAAEGDKLAVRFGDAAFDVAETAPHDVLRARLGSGDGSVEVGIRPEHLTLAVSGSGGLPGTVRTREAIGDGAILTVDAGASRLRVLTPSDRSVREGDTIALVPMMDRLHYFDAATGVRIDVEIDNPKLS